MDFKFPLFFNTLETKPVRGTDDFYRLIDEEVYKLENGILIDGVQISGWLYWHLNHWYIRIDKKEANGNVVRQTSLPYLRDNEWIRAEALEECRRQQKGYMEVGLRQGGKELADYEPVITENGYSPIGNAKVGDKIFSKDGKLCNITGVYPQGMKPIYRMYLSDGRFIDSGENHLWEVFNSDNRKMIKSTKDLLNTKISFPHKKSGTTYKYFIENCEEVEFSKKELPIPPYVLGVLLGDGCTTQGTNKINCLDKQIIDEIKILLPDYDINCQSFKNPDGTLNVCQHTIVYKGKQRLLYNENPLNKSLKELNLKCKAPYKFIPTIYKMSSIEDRYELIKGIFDTDGYISETGNIELKLSSKQLIEDVAWVLRSLGISCSIGILDKRGIKQKLPHGKTVFTEHIYYRLYVKTDKPIFKLERKLNRLKKRIRKNRVSINRIEFLCNHTATCITVDNPEHLFLTKDFIVTHNSELEASFLAYNATLFKNTQNVIVGGNSDDLILLKDKVDFGLKHLWEGIAIPRLDKTWKTSSVRLGYKLASGEDDIWSTIIIRNAADGNNTETAAGTTAKSYIMDEVGKYKFSKAFEAAKPALNSEFGWRAIPILVGTGGAFEKGEDAERFFYHPDANNFLGFLDPISGKKTCLFMSGLYRQDAKKDSTLGDFLVEKGVDLPKDSYLFSLFMKVKDEEKALEIINKEREAKKQDPDQQEYLKVIMYHPLTPEECFLSVSDNIFNRNIAKNQQRLLHENNITGSFVSLEHDGNSIKHTFLPNKKAISNFPHKHADDLDAPVQIWEMPVPNAPYGLYTAGVDSYRQANAADSSSLGAVYIFKRVHNIFDEKYKNMFVAAYVARPDDKNKWNETARNLIKFYNARTLVENDEYSFIDYMIAKGDEYYLEPEPQYLKALVANSRVTRRYGIHRSAPAIMNHLHTTFKSYMEEVIHTERDVKTGAIIKETLGVSQILDPMLLEEVIKFNPDLNVDRIVAAELALSLGLYLNRSVGTISSVEDDVRLQSYISGKRNKSVFNNNSTIFKTKKTLFR